MKTITAAKVSPESPFLLGSRAKYVLGYDDGAGVVIISQHQKADAALRVKTRVASSRAGYGKLDVYRVGGR